MRLFVADLRGVTALETALLAPFMFLLMLGVVEISRFFYTSHEVHAFAESIGRAGSVNGGAGLSVQAIGAQTFIVGDVSKAVTTKLRFQHQSISYTQISVEYDFGFFFAPLDNMFSQLTPIRVKKIYANSDF